MISFLSKPLESTRIAPRLFVAVAGLGPPFVALYRADDWLRNWHLVLIAAAMGLAAALLILAIGVAVRGSVGMVRRVALEIVALGCALVVAEVALIARAPETWPEDPLVRRLLARERAAERHAVEFEARLRSDVVRDLQSQGVDALPGYAQIIGSSPSISAAIRERGLLPLSNASNALIIECNEGPGFFKYRSDEHGFNNPPGIASGPLDVAVIGESLAVGHCVPPGKSAVDLLRAHFARTANFGVAGSRVLAQVAVFREYAAPLAPPVVVWFVNANFALPRNELDQPVLVRYLDDPKFSQGLRARQDEIDSFVRELLVPLNLARDDALRTEMAQASRLPLLRMVKFRDVRGLVSVPQALQRPQPAPDLSHFERALDLIVNSARQWGGTVVVVALPSFQLSNKDPATVTRHAAVLRALERRPVSVVDGGAVFAAQTDVESLFTLGIANHPSEKGHALLAGAIVAAIEGEGIHGSPGNIATH